jgi:hypothetical protein
LPSVFIPPLGNRFKKYPQVKPTPKENLLSGQAEQIESLFL